MERMNTSCLVTLDFALGVVLEMAVALKAAFDDFAELVGKDGMVE
jgi:hypothetical protein